jgi:hypothetical protein
MAQFFKAPKSPKNNDFFSNYLVSTTNDDGKETFTIKNNDWC